MIYIVSRAQSTAIIKPLLNNANLDTYSFVTDNHTPVQGTATLLVRSSGYDTKACVNGIHSLTGKNCRPDCAIDYKQIRVGAEHAIEADIDNLEPCLWNIQAQYKTPHDHFVICPSPSD